MNLNCPVCGKRSIPLLKKLVFFETKRSNRFQCSACRAALQCEFTPLLFFMVGVLLHFVVIAITERSTSLSKAGLAGLAVMALMFVVIPIRSAGQARNDSTAASKRSFDQALHFLESKLFSIAVWLSVTAIALRVMRSRVDGELGFGGLIYLFGAAILGVMASLVYVALIDRFGRRDVRIRVLINALAGACALFAFA
ncbi:MAG TPA: hypothetical protein VFO36_05125 [Nitrospiraceae bacterium]|nr:hypothetical protein [Nitrospiraceae bacterium]